LKQEREKNEIALQAMIQANIERSLRFSDYKWSVDEFTMGSRNVMPDYAYEYLGKINEIDHLLMVFQQIVMFIGDGNHP